MTLRLLIERAGEKRERRMFLVETTNLFKFELKLRRVQEKFKESTRAVLGFLDHYLFHLTKLLISIPGLRKKR